MTRPTPFLLRMLAFLLAVLAVAAVLFPVLRGVFWHNPVINGLILIILVLGIGWNVRQVAGLSPEVTWLETFQRRRTQLTALPNPRLLAPVAAMLAKAQKRAGAEERISLSAPAMRSLLDTIASRLDESRELSRYMTGVMIFLGLLGTFWGLLLTISSVSDVIRSMSIGTGSVGQMFGQLKAGLAGPLTGMSTAFGSSLFGLSGALVLGFLDLTAGQAQNRFYNELEEWLAGLTRLSTGALGTDGETSVPVYVQALLEQTAENMEGLQRVLLRGEEGRGQANQMLMALSEKLGALSDTMRTSQQLMLRIAEAQAQLGPALQRLAERPADASFDEVARGHLRNIEITLQRLLADAEQGRAQSTAELRSDLRILTRTIAALAEEPQR
ncbi:MAG: flagellar motor protein MotA [Acetobacteraceae bacterium]